MSRYWETEPEMADQEFEDYQADLERSLRDLVTFARETTPEDVVHLTLWQRFVRWWRGG